MKLFRRPTDPLRLGNMADVLGVDLKTAISEGDLSQRQYVQASTRCGECRGSIACQLWLQSYTDCTENPEIAPSFCPNKQMYTDLKS